PGEAPPPPTGPGNGAEPDVDEDGTPPTAALRGQGGREQRGSARLATAPPLGPLRGARSGGGDVGQKGTARARRRRSLQTVDGGFRRGRALRPPARLPPWCSAASGAAQRRRDRGARLCGAGGAGAE